MPSFLKTGKVSPARAVTNQIGPAVVIVVFELHAHAGHRLTVIAQGCTAEQADFFEGAIAFIVEEEIRHVVVGYENIGETIVVIIGESDAHTASREWPNSGAFVTSSKMPSPQFLYRVLAGLGSTWDGSTCECRDVESPQ